MAVYPYEVVVIAPSGHTHRHELASDRPLEEGDLVPFADERWLVVRIEPNERGPFRAVVTPARFRIVLRHADGREEVGAVELYRDESPWIGHAFSTGTGGRAMSWQLQGRRIFASAGMPEDEEDPDKAHGWMCRLLDSGALGAAGFKRVRKADLSSI